MAKVLCVLYEDPVDGYQPSYTREDIPHIECYPNGQTVPTPQTIDFVPGQLLGICAGTACGRPPRRSQRALLTHCAPASGWTVSRFFFDTGSTMSGPEPLHTAYPGLMSEETKFQALLRKQIRNEFTASQQYAAVAVYADDQDLPRLAAHFYAQSLEERNHAMSMVQYLLDSDLPVQIPGVDDVRNGFSSVEEVVQFALAQEKAVTAQITTLAPTARDEGDYLGEQFMQWFLKEQVEEVSSMSTLLTVVQRAADNLFQVEDFVARELGKVAGAPDPTTPPAAGGRV
jgi:ferritin